MVAPALAVRPVKKPEKFSGRGVRPSHAAAAPPRSPRLWVSRRSLGQGSFQVQFWSPDRRRLIDAVAPAEDILDREESAGSSLDATQRFEKRRPHAGRQCRLADRARAVLRAHPVSNRRDVQRRAPFLGSALLPPDHERLGIVGAGRGDRCGRIRRPGLDTAGPSSCQWRSQRNTR